MDDAIPVTARSPRSTPGERCLRVASRPLRQSERAEMTGLQFSCPSPSLSARTPTIHTGAQKRAPQNPPPSQLPPVPYDRSGVSICVFTSSVPQQLQRHHTIYLNNPPSQATSVAPFDQATSASSNLDSVDMDKPRSLGNGNGKASNGRASSSDLRKKKSRSKLKPGPGPGLCVRGAPFSALLWGDTQDYHHA